ncbi:hypothetical protein DdX_20377 [Ditylenchus destructor]|uniref:Uncharacterized protein n=1 Tax=Ditylenchus destructor TaxID=166010 RepID=A0AAD4MHA4_9BILA|nr:hypothetical protein DdX_20377 [Ditylenchus destructor]
MHNTIGTKGSRTMNGLPPNRAWARRAQATSPVCKTQRSAPSNPIAVRRPLKLRSGVETDPTPALLHLSEMEGRAPQSSLHGSALFRKSSRIQRNVSGFCASSGTPGRIPADERIIADDDQSPRMRTGNPDAPAAPVPPTGRAVRDSRSAPYLDWLIP